jgi:transcriptional regulator with XRE-family HTH domain
MINPPRLQQARELRGWTQTALAQQVGVHPSAIAQLETGRIQPSPLVLDAISRATGFPPAFFTRPSGSPLPPGSLRFRARAAMTARQRRQGWWYAQTLYELMAALAVQAELPAPRLPRLDGDPVAAACRVRQALGLAPDQPIGALIRALERAGVWVLAIPVPLPRRDACSAWAGGDGATPVIVVAATSAGDRRRFSVAHEVGHLVLHQVPQGAPQALEQQADAFAEAFLLPEGAMHQALVPFGQKTQTCLSRRGYGSTLVPSQLAFHPPLPHTHSQSQRQPWRLYDYGVEETAGVYYRIGRPGAAAPQRVSGHRESHAPPADSGSCALDGG